MKYPQPATKMVLASNNPGKLREMQQLLAASAFDVVPQSAFAVGEVAETGLSFVENALIKARFVAESTGLPALADDSGLEVDFLEGAPGIYSARYAGQQASDEDNVEKLLAALEGVPEAYRRARFQCVIVYLRHAVDPTPLIAQGTWEGAILTEPQGHNGFGYDPVFYVPEHQCSAAELSAEQKNRLSHRGQALNQLLRQLAARQAVNTH